MATLGLGLTTDYGTGFFLRILCGLGAGCVYSSCLKSIVTWFAPAQRGLAIGVLMTAPTLGIALPNLIMPALNNSMGWQGVFGIIGVFAPSAAGWLCGKFPNSKKGMIIMCHVLVIILLLAFGQLTTMGACYGMAITLGIRWLSRKTRGRNGRPRPAAWATPFSSGIARDLSGGFGYTWYILAAGAIFGVFMALGLTHKTQEA